MAASVVLPTFTTFGEMLHYLRRSARLTQRELAIATGYSESMISRLEHDERPPDVATILALFAPAFDVQDQPEIVARLVELAQNARGEKGERSQSPPLRGDWRSSAIRHRLPARLTSFVGREADMLAVAQQLARVRLVTLTGPGGCGKTSLAVEVGRRLAETGLPITHGGTVAQANMFDSVNLIELYPLADPGSIAQTVLAVLNLEGNAEQPALRTLLNQIGDRSMLLVLDNCEHLVDEAAHFVQALLQGCPHLRILAASRERLNIAAETVYPVAPLAAPDLHPLPNMAEIAGFPAVQLFIERGQAVMPSLQLTPQNATAVAQICTLLDGIPLALELGAAVTAIFSVQEIAERLSENVLLANAGYRNADPRHTSIQDTVDWSYNLLAPAEQQLLAELAVFAGGWTVEAMQQVCLDAPQCVAILRQLVQKSLVQVEHAPSGAGATRYFLLRAVREYAAERLACTGNEEAVRRRHFGYFAQLGMTLGEQVMGRQHSTAMAGLDADYPNIHATLVFAAQRADLAEQRARLATALPFYWRRRSYLTEGMSWLREAVEDDGHLSLAALALAHAAALNLAVDAACLDYHSSAVDPATQRILDRADALIAPCLEQGEEQAAALLMFTVGSLQDYPGNEVKATAYAKEAWAIFKKSANRRGAGFACNLLARLHLNQGDVQSAEHVHQGAISFFEQNGMTWGLCEAYRIQAEIAQIKQDRPTLMRNYIHIAELSEIGQFTPFVHFVYRKLEDIDGALACKMAEQLLGRQRQGGSPEMVALALHQLGRIHLNAGRYQAAEAPLDEALQLWPRLGELHGMGIGSKWSLIDRGQVARFLGDHKLAIACFSESIRLFGPDTYGTAPTLYRGQVRFEVGDMVGALEDYRFCLHRTLKAPHNWPHLIVYSLTGIGEVAWERGNAADAAKLLAAAATLNVKRGDLVSMGNMHDYRCFERSMAAAAEHRCIPVFEVAWQEGEKLTLEEAGALALEQ